MATGMAIMGFGGGAMIGAPLAQMLMAHFATPGSPACGRPSWCMGLIYFVFMMGGAFGYRVARHRTGSRPDGRGLHANVKAMITHGQVHLKDAHKTPPSGASGWCCA